MRVMPLFKFGIIYRQAYNCEPLSVQQDTCCTDNGSQLYACLYKMPNLKRGITLKHIIVNHCQYSKTVYDLVDFFLW